MGGSASSRTPCLCACRGRGGVSWERRDLASDQWVPFNHDCQGYLEAAYVRCLKCELKERIHVRTTAHGYPSRFSMDFRTMTCKEIGPQTKREIASARRTEEGVVAAFGTFRVVGGDVLSAADQNALAISWRQVPRPPSFTLPESGLPVENFEGLELDAARCGGRLLEVLVPLELSPCQVLMPEEMEASDTRSMYDFGTRLGGPGAGEDPAGGDGTATCKICCCDIEPAEPACRLHCGHAFHEPCLEQWFRARRRCPTCGRTFGKVFGQQPLAGRMRWRLSDVLLPGHPKSPQSLALEFDFPAGRHDDGRAYVRRNPWCYLPTDTQGAVLLALYKVAFRRRVMFGFGERLKDGSFGATFNIHIKTGKACGMERHGYPDETYFTRCLGELRDNGVTMADLPTERT